MRAITSGLLLVLALAMPLTPQPAKAEATSSIQVMGQGQAAVAPDMAILSLTVMREAETAREALDEANAAMGQVIAAMREQGIAERDLQTSGLSISPRYVYPERGQDTAPRIVAYQVSNSLTVRVRDIEQVGEVLDLSVTMGVNQDGGIQLTNDDPAAALEEARREAVDNARAKAETLAEAAGVRLGRVLSISEQARPPIARPMGQPVMLRMEAADAAVPIEAGENVFEIHVGMSFEILQ
jgi:uncharacterized protein